MRSLDFIYSRKMLIALGLVVVTVSLAVVYWLNIKQDSEQAENQQSNGAQSSEPIPSTVPSTQPPQSQTTWSTPTDGPSYAAGSAEAQAAAALNEIGVALQNQDSQKLYDMLSSEIKDIYTVESVRLAMGETDGLALRPEGEIKMKADFAEQKVIGTDAQGQEQEFLVVLRNEDGAWKLYGTTTL